MSEIKIGLFGLGTVGTGIVKVLSRAINANAVIKKICVRHIDKKRDVEIDKNLLTNNIS